MNETQLTIFGYAVLAGWVPAILVMFALMRPRRAVIAAFVIGYLFLPEWTLKYQTLPDISKVSLTSFGVVLGSFIFDGGRLFSVRPRFIDLGVVVLLVSSIATSMVNDLGIMDGLSASANIAFTWGAAYWIGRAYFTDWEAVRELVVGTIMGGVAYVPLCWWEIRMSPQLHGRLYGLLFQSFREDNYLFGIRLPGFRPNVFLLDGLRVTMFMGVCAVLAFWAWISKSPRKILGVPMGLIAFTLIVTTFMCKAMGGVSLMLGGITVLLLTKWPKTRLPALLLALAAPLYMAVRTPGDWSGNFLIQVADDVSHTRAESLKFRLTNENMLAGKALERPLLGWGGWNRSHVYDWFDQRDLTIPDGLWIILFGVYGLIGLGAFTLMVTGPVLLIWKRIPTRFWSDPACSAAVSLAVVLAMYMVDSLFNATFNPIAAVSAGAAGSIAGVAGTVFSRKALAAAKAARSATAPPGRPGGTAYAPVAVAGAGTVRSPRDIPYVYSIGG